MTDNEFAEQVAAEVTEFTSLIRARMAGAFDDDNPPGESPAEQMWQNVYGRTALASDTAEGLVREFGHILFRKLNVACIVATMLAIDLAKQTGRSAAEVVDEVERRIREMGGQM